MCQIPTGNVNILYNKHLLIKQDLVLDVTGHHFFLYSEGHTDQSWYDVEVSYKMAWISEVIDNCRLLEAVLSTIWAYEYKV